MQRMRQLKRCYGVMTETFFWSPHPHENVPTEVLLKQKAAQQLYVCFGSKGSHLLSTGLEELKRGKVKAENKKQSSTT